MKMSEEIKYRKNYSGSDKKYFRRILGDIGQIKIFIQWFFDEQQADPINKNFTTEEFVSRLERLVNKEEK